MINHKFGLDKSFQEVLYKIDNWINESSGWIIESIVSHYINISTYRPLIGISYIKLPVQLRSFKKGLINIKNNDQKCFLWCNARHINPVKIHAERITQKDKELANDLDYRKAKFPISKEDFRKIETKNNICINVFCYKNNLFFLIYISDQKFENSLDLLLIIDEKTSHMCTSKISTDSCFTKQKIKTKNTFAKAVYSALVVKMY